MTLKPSLRPGEGFSYYILHVKCHRAKTIHLSPYLWLTFSPVNKSNSRNLQSFFKKKNKRKHHTNHSHTILVNNTMVLSKTQSSVVLHHRRYQMIRNLPVPNNRYRGTHTLVKQTYTVSQRHNLGYIPP